RGLALHVHERRQHDRYRHPVRGLLAEEGVLLRQLGRVLLGQLLARRHLDGQVLPLLILVLAVCLVTGCGSMMRAERDRATSARRASFSRARTKPGELPNSAVAALRLDRGKARRVGLFHGRSLWVAPTQKGETC